jgi:small subunit ribosomal protein S8
MIHSLINDYLIRLKNASLAEKVEVVSPFSNYIKDIAALLKKNGFITDFKVEKNKIITEVKSVSQVKLFSTPGRKLYTKATQIPYGNDKKSLIIISTSRGVMGQREAVKAHLGGQLIAEINY